MTGPQPHSPLSRADVAFLAERGIAESEAHAQMLRLAQAPSSRKLMRACTVDDGILRPDEGLAESALKAWEDHEGGRRFEKWIPASGAASRMFRDLANADPETLTQLERNLDRFPFADQLRLATDDHDPAKLAQALVQEPLGFGALPKALIPFHAYPGGSRTALEEHIIEARLLGPSEPALTFTVSAEHRELFEEEVRREPTGPCRIHLTEQDIASSTLAWNPTAMDLVRDGDGQPLLRPGGHGALLTNLNRAGSSHLFIRNIDNIQPQDRHQEVVRWKKVLAGLALVYSRRVAAAVRELAMPSEPGVKPILELLAELGLASPADSDPEHLHLLLDRPLRVCGLVRNEGEPGGGPFWVQLPNGEVRTQIVESAEVESEDRGQLSIWRSSTHFNPVDIACVLERGDGSRFHLPDYADPSAVFVNQRSVRGRDARVLERPGLWNGGMAYWHTVLVEVPASTFAPVKSVFDLLRPQHQPLSGQR